VAGLAVGAGVSDIPWLLDYWATRRPDHPALIWDSGDQPQKQWTYGQLRDDVWRLAAGLAARGIAPGDRVLVHADNSPEFVISWLACATAGAVAVTTNTRSVAPEIRFFIDKTDAVAAITDPQYASLVAEAGPGLKWIAVTGTSGEDGWSGLLRPDPVEWTGREVEPMRPFGIMFTSGTTNKPKAVVHTHANAIWASRMGPRNIDLAGPNGRYLIYLPFFHVNAQSWSFFSVLGVGATAILMPKWSTSRFWDVVVRHHVTHISLMPFCLPALGGPDRPLTSDLRVGVFGAIMPDWDKQFGLSVYAAYGMTETVTHSINGKPYEALMPGSMGRVGAGYEMAVVDQDTGRHFSAKEVEEVISRVPGVVQVAVVGKQHDWLNQVVVAFVIKGPSAPPDLSDAVVQACQSRLADFKVPRAVYFVDGFPTGTLDKILKNRLREMADAEPAVP
jgi:crotonobetaine/carnitine-CoA ligase